MCRSRREDQRRVISNLTLKKRQQKAICTVDSNKCLKPHDKIKSNKSLATRANICIDISDRSKTAMARRLCEVSSRVAVVLRHPLGSYNAVDNSRKLLCPVPLVTRTIFRHLGWWSSTGFCLPSVRASTDARRSAQESSAPKGGQVLEFNSKQLQAERRAESSLALQDMFGLSKEEADKVVENVKGFSAVKDKDIRQNYRTLLDFGFSDKLIKELPAALAMPVDILLAKIRLMNFMKWGDIDDTFPFLRMNTTILRRFAGRIKAETTSSGGSNRITLLASKLQVI